MVETVYQMSTAQPIEKLIANEHIQYIHMLFTQGEGLPEHNANSPVYMTVIRGMLSITLDGQDAHRYAGGTLLSIPTGTHMKVRNLDPDALELIVVKAPPPGA